MISSASGWMEVCDGYVCGARDLQCRRNGAFDHGAAAGQLLSASNRIDEPKKSPGAHIFRVGSTTLARRGIAMRPTNRRHLR